MLGAGVKGGEGEGSRDPLLGEHMRGVFCMRLLTPDIDQERDPERVLQFSYNFLGRNGTPCRVTQRYTEQRLKRVPVPLLWIQQEGKGQAWQTGLGLANVNIFSTL